MTALDRTRPPAPAPNPPVALPEIRRVDVAGTQALTVAFDAVPITRVAIAVPGAARLREEPERLGLASLTGAMLREGTGGLDGVALQETLDGMGATLDVECSDDELVVHLTALNRELPRAAQLVRDVLHAPRLADADFARLVRRRLVELESRADDPARVAQDAWRAVLYGTDRVEGMPALGTPETVERLTSDDARAFWALALAYGAPRLAWVGSVEVAVLAPLS
ncbi:MAG: insulinase family protein, partial [Planctomycetota bacterium]|nr:insulinase family protein [Planctomycetota bacterium]